MRDAARPSYTMIAVCGGPSTPPPPRLTLVPNEPVPVPIEAEPEGTAAQGLLVAMPAVQVSEGDGGFTF